MAHIAKQVPKVRKQCRLRRVNQVETLWRVAWVTGVRAPSKQPRCRQAPTHWARFKRWRPYWAYLIEDNLTVGVR